MGDNNKDLGSLSDEELRLAIEAKRSEAARGVGDSTPEGAPLLAQPTSLTRTPEQEPGLIERGMRTLGRFTKENAGEMIGGGVGAAASIPFRATPMGVPIGAALEGLGAGAGRLAQSNIENVGNLIRGEEVRPAGEVLSEAGRAAGINAMLTPLGPVLNRVFGRAGAFASKTSSETVERVLARPKEVMALISDASKEQAAELAKKMGRTLENWQEVVGDAYGKAVDMALSQGEGRSISVAPVIEAAERGLKKLRRAPGPKKSPILGPRGEELITPGSGDGPSRVALKSPGSSVKKAVRALNNVRDTLKNVGDVSLRELHELQMEINSVISDVADDKTTMKFLGEVAAEVREIMGKNSQLISKANGMYSNMKDIVADGAALLRADNPRQKIISASKNFSMLNDAIKEAAEHIPAFKELREQVFDVEAAADLQPLIRFPLTGFTPGTAGMMANTLGTLGGAASLGLFSPRLAAKNLAASTGKMAQSTTERFFRGATQAGLAREADLLQQNIRGVKRNTSP